MSLPDRLSRLTGAALLLFSMQSLADHDLRFRLVPRATVEARLGQYEGNNDERQATLREMFAAVGCGEHISEQPLQPRPPNLICVLPGTSDRVIIVGAHFDRVTQSAGVADNWSGASLLPSLYEAVRIVPRQHTYVFVAFSAEEEGRIGSRAYVRKMTREQMAATDAMVNIDTLGLDSTNVWYNHSDKDLVVALAYVATLIGSPLKRQDFERVGSTDSESFARRGMRSIAIHSLNQTNYNAAIIHSPRDKLSAINVDQFYESYRLMAAYLVYLDHGLDPEPTSPDTH